MRLLDQMFQEPDRPWYWVAGLMLMFASGLWLVFGPAPIWAIPPHGLLTGIVLFRVLVAAGVVKAQRGPGYYADRVERRQSKSDKK